MGKLKLPAIIRLFNWSSEHWAWEARLLRWLTFVWLIIGLTTLFSASYIVSQENFGDGLHYFKTQLIWVGIGLVAFQAFSTFPTRYVLTVSDLFVLLFLSLIIATLLPGVGSTAYGATRWLVIGPIGIQPSELMKPFIVLQSARVFGRWHSLSPIVRGSWITVFCLVLICILLQPNLSTAALCGMVIWLIAFSSGLNLRYVLGSAVFGFTLAVISVSIHEYQRIRLISFLNPWNDPTGNSYQLVQSLLAIGSGGWLGSGFGLSQQKLFYLPIQYTDFIFSVFAEEFGFLGCLLLFALLGAFATLGLRVALAAPKKTYKLIAIGLVTLLVGQSLLNIGVATGALPTTGLPFPMLSYGGSSMIASLTAAGLLVRVARECREADILPLPMSRTVSRKR